MGLAPPFVLFAFVSFNRSGIMKYGIILIIIWLRIIRLRGILLCLMVVGVMLTFMVEEF